MLLVQYITLKMQLKKYHWIKRYWRSFFGTAKDLIRQFLIALRKKSGNKNSHITKVPFLCDFSTALKKISSTAIFLPPVKLTRTSQLWIVDISCVVGTLHLCRYLSLVLRDLLRTGRSGIESRWGRDFPAAHTGPGTHTGSCKMGTGSFSGVKCGRGVGLTTHPLLVSRSWKRKCASYTKHT